MSRCDCGRALIGYREYEVSELMRRFGRRLARGGETHEDAINAVLRGET